MGTRGCYGVRIDGQDKLTYNHFDSYPEGLGQDLVNQLVPVLATKTGLARLRKAARELELVGDNPEDRAAIKARFGDRYRDPGVDTGDSVYAYLRNLQGELTGALFDAKVMHDDRDFVRDSLFCEYAYVVNLDDKVFEIYQGVQDKPHTRGRYAGLASIPRPPGASTEYYPVALVKTLPLNKNLKRNYSAFLKKLEEASEQT